MEIDKSHLKIKTIWKTNQTQTEIRLWDTVQVYHLMFQQMTVYWKYTVSQFLK